MHKASRLINLIMAINRKKHFTAKELANEFNVSLRTIQRDILELADLGVYLYSKVGVSGGYSLLNERILPPISFTENEATAMFFAYQALENYTSIPFGEESSSALEKFYSHLPEDTKRRIDSMRDRVMFWNPKREFSNNYLQELLEASISKDTIKIRYNSDNGITERDIQPIGIYSQNGLWYCPGYCCLKKGLRLFRVDRVISIDINNKINEVNHIGNMMISDWFMPPESQTNLILKVNLTKSGVRECKSEPKLAQNINLNNDESGNINTTIPKSEVKYYADYFFCLADKALVLEPKELVDIIKNKLNSTSILYGIHIK